MPKKIITRTREEAYELWIKALLSGKYKQGIGQLCDRDTASQTLRFCCLGVLCDLAAKDGGAPWQTDLWWTRAPALSIHGTSATLPKKIRKFMGMTAHDEGTLMLANDKENRSFKEIAELIRTKIMPKALKRS